jgi:hypothetical protein
VHDVAVALDPHEAAHVDGARHADPAEVVAAQVDEHHVLGPLLGVGAQLVGRLGVLQASAPRGRVPAGGCTTAGRR